ncbi:MAG: Glycine/D-amino acid oxidase [Rubritepida sp.]|nr:Glycine/D-amino acid oxidase [Rubritepida sp.]
MSRIVIVGGGIIGSSTAYHLARAGCAADVIVVEPDPTYEFAATPRATGGVRLQHSVRENVEMSLYGDAVYSGFAEHVTGGKVDYDPQFKRIGYLYQVKGARNVELLQADAEMQRQLGVDVEILDRAALRARYPSFVFDEVDAAALSPDGQIDPHGALMGMRKAAEGLGITYLKDRVVGLDVSDGLVSMVRLESGVTLPVDTLVNAANCWASDICDMVGMPVPIGPLPRQQFFFDSRTDIETIPAMRGDDGFSFRPHSLGYLCGHTRYGQPFGFNWEQDHEVFESELWPRLAERCPAFEAIKLKGGWVGHYDMNPLDGNMVLDRFHKVPNFILAAGFSGHGLMHAPAVGRAIKEMIMDGGFRSIDLSRFSYRRIEQNEPIPDNGPKA